MDSKLLVPSKLLGTGKQTRREEMIEALELEDRAAETRELKKSCMKKER